MKKFTVAMFGLVLLGCSHTPPPALGSAPPTPLTEEALYALNLTLHERCMVGRDPNKQFYQDFCFCTSRVITNNIREKLGTVEDLRTKLALATPTKAAVNGCILEALSSALANPEEE